MGPVGGPTRKGWRTVTLEDQVNVQVTVPAPVMVR